MKSSITIGAQFGRLTVVAKSLTQKDSWVCNCACGTTGKYIYSGNLRRMVSCGCYSRETASIRATKHGAQRTPTWNIWISMKGRCYCASNSGYARYGSKGIKVCDRWLADFSAFLSDMGERPAGMTLDRIDNAGDYCPENCRWATPKEQAINRRSTRLISFQGETLCISAWAHRVGISPSAFSRRIRKFGIRQAFEMGARQS